MTYTLGLLTLGWLLPNPGIAAPETPQISYEVKVMTFNGLGWRQKFHYDLETVATQGMKTVWTLDQSKLKEFQSAASTVVTQPKVTALEDTAATVKSTQPHYYVKTVKRVSDGPRYQGTQIGFNPEVQKVNDGFDVRLSGHCLDQGILTKVKIDDSLFMGFTNVPIKDGIREDKTKGTRAMSISAIYQLPSIFEAHLEGEWIAPSEGALIVGLGRMPGQKNGELVERVVMISPKKVILEEDESILPGAAPASASRVKSAMLPMPGHLEYFPVDSVRLFDMPKTVGSTKTSVISKGVEVETIVERVGFDFAAETARKETRLDKLTKAIDALRLEAEALKLTTNLGTLPSPMPHRAAYVERTVVVPKVATSSKINSPVRLWAQDGDVKRIGFDFNFAFDPQDPTIDMLTKVVEFFQDTTVGPPQIPALPSRNLPVAIDSAGKKVSLPPLPDSEMKPAAFDEDGKPVPTPQSAKVETSSVESGDNYHSDFPWATAKNAAQSAQKNAFAAQTTLDTDKLARLETQTIRVPFGDKMMIEIQAKIVPNLAKANASKTQCDDDDACCAATKK